MYIVRRRRPCKSQVLPLLQRIAQDKASKARACIYQKPPSNPPTNITGNNRNHNIQNLIFLSHSYSQTVQVGQNQSNVRSPSVKGIDSVTVSCSYPLFAGTLKFYNFEGHQPGWYGIGARQWPKPPKHEPVAWIIRVTQQVPWNKEVGYFRPADGFNF